MYEYWTWPIVLVCCDLVSKSTNAITIKKVYSDVLKLPKRDSLYSTELRSSSLKGKLAAPMTTELLATTTANLYSVCVWYGNSVNQLRNVVRGVLRCPWPPPPFGKAFSSKLPGEYLTLTECDRLFEKSWLRRCDCRKYDDYVNLLSTNYAALLRGILGLHVTSSFSKIQN